MKIKEAEENDQWYQNKQWRNDDEGRKRCYH
jgi:hypothetical protein